MLSSPSLMGIAGGVPGSAIDDNESWNGTAWTEGTDINTARTYLAGDGASSTSAIIAGGANPSAYANTETWNGTAWTEVNDLNTARHGLAGAGPVTSFLAFGGSTGSAPYIDNTEEWNGISWVEVADLSQARQQLNSAGASNTSALAIGGWVPPNTNVTEEWSGSSVTTKTVDID